MLKGQNRELWDKAEDQRRRCEEWLRQFMRDGQPKLATKAELREVAMRELQISKSSFGTGWIGSIEATGRQDWYEPLRGKRARQ